MNGATHPAVQAACFFPHSSVYLKERRKMDNFFSWLATIFNQLMAFITEEKLLVVVAVGLAIIIADLIIGRGRLKSVGSIIGFLVGFCLLFWGFVIYIENAPKQIGLAYGQAVLGAHEAVATNQALGVQEQPLFVWGTTPMPDSGKSVAVTPAPEVEPDSGENRLPSEKKVLREDALSVWMKTQLTYPAGFVALSLSDIPAGVICEAKAKTIEEKTCGGLFWTEEATNKCRLGRDSAEVWSISCWDTGMELTPIEFEANGLWTRPIFSVTSGKTVAQVQGTGDWSKWPACWKTVEVLPTATPTAEASSSVAQPGGQYLFSAPVEGYCGLESTTGSAWDRILICTGGQADGRSVPREEVPGEILELFPSP